MKHDRLTEIKKMLLSQKKLTTKEVCDKFNISIETVRRDFNQLEQEGCIRKVYGGAVLADDSLFPDAVEKWDVRLSENWEEKKTIASQVASIIPDNCTVWLDTGTSIFEVACQLKERSNLTIVTNSLRIATELGMCGNLTVYCVGGIIKTDVLNTSGFLAMEFLKYFSHIDIAVISGDAFVPEKGTMEYSMEMVTLKQSILDKTDKVIVAIDHTKFDARANFIACPTPMIHTFVTDKDTPEDAVQLIQEQGVKVIVAGMN